MKRTLLYAGVACALAVGAAPAAAQENFSTRGLMFGVRAHSLAIQSDEEGGSAAERGLGLGAMAGYGFTDRITGFVRADLSNNVAYGGEEEEGSYSVGIVDLGVRYGFGLPTAALRPYAEGGVSGTSVKDELTVAGQEVDVSLTGGALFIGGGLEYFFSRAAAADVGLALGKGRLTQASVDGESFDDAEDVDFTTIRLSVGITLRP